MVKNLKIVFIVQCSLLIFGYIAFLLFGSFVEANAFFVGFIIICIDLFFLARYLNNAVKNATINGFLLQSVFRWFFIAICIYVALVMLKLYKWSFIVGIILPFMGVLITGIYQIFRRKEDGTSS